MGKSKYSNEFKVDCIVGGTVDYVNRELKKMYKSLDGEAFLYWCDLVSREAPIDCSMRLLESKYRKYARAREHIKDIVLNGNAIFITLTFTDEVLKKTTPSTRRRYVARYLKSQSDLYVANIDYSPSKQREHYHAVVSGRIDMAPWTSKYGYVWTEQVRTHDFDYKRVARYVAKLTSHAFKVNSTRLIYSRDNV